MGSRRASPLGIAAVAAVGIVLHVGALRRKRAVTVSLNAEVVTLQASNEYGGVIGSGLLPWRHIVEPHRETTLTVLVNGEPCDDRCTSAQWWVDGAPAAVGGRVTHSFTRAGLHTVQFVGPTNRLVEDTVMSKWVRRELRDLSTEDRDKFFAAMHTVWHVDTATGQQRFASTKYKGAEYFVRKHLAGAASTECDHWHDNAGLMTHHMAFTLEMEQALQAIDARIAMPYWEYSLDAMILGNDWEAADVFDKGWFGAASPAGPLHTVTEGRWAYTPVMSNARSYSNITNQWAQLRSPWNQNPAPFVARHRKILGNGNFQATFPACRDFNTAMLTTSFADIMPYLNGLTHGPVHLMIGGQWHQNSSAVDLFFDGQQSNFLLMSKILWRHGFMRCHDSCVENVTDLDSCACTCPAEYLDHTSAYDILVNETGILHWLAADSRGKIRYDTKLGSYYVVGYTRDQNEQAWVAIYDALCNPGWVGDMFTSAAPVDPIFYVIHTTAERFLWTRILLARAEPDAWFFDDTWGYSHDVATPSDTGEVCYWDNLPTDAGLDLPSCVTLTCPGHRYNDTIPFEDFIGGDDSYTNEQFWKLMQPTSNTLPYTYANFEYPWCADQGYDWTANASRSS